VDSIIYSVIFILPTIKFVSLGSRHQASINHLNSAGKSVKDTRTRILVLPEGKFYLITQTAKDYRSTGPWVEKVESRVGVDTTNNGKIDTWSKWSEVKETYDYIKGFSKQIKKNPARQNLADLPEGYGFQIEVKINDITSNASKPLIESLELSFKD
jgi:hypothetical protein